MHQPTTTGKYIDPYTDFGFTKLFGSKNNKDLLIDFLNELVNDKGKITSVSYRKPRQSDALPTDGGAIFDVYCQTDCGEKFIVEMQKFNDNCFEYRSDFYHAYPIYHRAKKSASTAAKPAIYLIGLLNFTFVGTQLNDCDYHHEIKWMNTLTQTVFNHKFASIYLEMPKYGKKSYDMETHLDKWFYVLNHLATLQQRPACLQEPIFKKLFNIAEIAGLSAKERDAYESSLKARRPLEEETAPPA
jgi:predicted transposase/invertase (TIGR01784 family)